jgi:oligoendopeptidase F
MTHTSDVGSASEVVSEEFTWDLQSIFKNSEDWRAEYLTVQAEIAKVEAYRGKLLTSPETLLEFIQLSATLDTRISKLFVYAHLRYYANTLDESARSLLDEAEQLNARFASMHAFFRPELLAAPPGVIQKMVSGYEPLAPYRHFLDEVERYRPYTLSTELERVLETLSPVSSIPETIRTALNDAELSFASVEIGKERHEISHGTIDAILSNPNREVRKRAYEAYTDGYLKFPQTFSQTLVSQAKMSLAFSKARGYSSTFEAQMFRDAFPEKIFSVVLNACKEHRPLFHRYFRARAAILGVATLAEYDLMAPLSASQPSCSYEQARQLVIESCAPLGAEYVDVVRRALYKERWVDVYPRPGKYSNAFSSGTYGTRPFLLLNYAPTMTEVGTLAHELGHSMHSYLTHRSQPSCYASYAMSVAETASNLNQVLLRAKILATQDREMTLAVLEEAFFFAHRYLFLMPTMSEVEHALHSAYAKGGAMSASEISEMTASVFMKAYGDAVEVEPQRLGVKWAKFCHFYAPYYFFQYAIGISAAMAIGQRILNGEKGIQEKYLRFLSSGGSGYPYDLFKIVDVDITSPETYRAAFKVVEGYVEMLEKAAGQGR